MRAEQFLSVENGMFTAVMVCFLAFERKYLFRALRTFELRVCLK